MMSLGIGELIVLLIIVFVIMWPAAKICRRLGFSSWLAILIIVPIANLILLWFVALAEWPRFPGSRDSAT